MASGHACMYKVGLKPLKTHLRLIMLWGKEKVLHAWGSCSYIVQSLKNDLWSHIWRVTFCEFNNLAIRATVHDAYMLGCLHDGQLTCIFWYADCSCLVHTLSISIASYPGTPTQILLWEPIWHLPYRVVCSCTSRCEGELRNITKQLLECCEGFVTRPEDPWERRHRSRLSILTTEGCPLSKSS